LNNRFYSVNFHYASLRNGTHRIIIKYSLLNVDDFEDVVFNPLSEKHLLTLPEQPNITPENIKQKLKTYLLFL
jgi:hypothetical protein